MANHRQFGLGSERSSRPRHSSRKPEPMQDAEEFPDLAGVCPQTVPITAESKISNPPLEHGLSGFPDFCAERNGRQTCKVFPMNP